MLKLFLNYRRDDWLVTGAIGGIYDRLAEHYGKPNVFRDVDTIPPGQDFRKVLSRAVEQADVLLALIGPQWTELLKGRIDDPGDFVRIEIESALQREIPVVPVLIGPSQMPKDAELPASIAQIRYHNAFLVDPRGRDFHTQLARLIADLDQHYGEASSVREPVAPPAPEPKREPVRTAGDGLTNSLGMEMVWCPPGKFLMGSPESEEGREEWETQHEVTLTEGFWISRYQVPQQQWQQLMGSNPSYYTESGPQAPVERVSWDETMEFCRKLSESAQGDYTLPTEAQWEYACRAGTTGPFAGGSLDALGWYRENSGNQTYPVGQKSPNPWGVYDMHGNVWEWCLDSSDSPPASDGNSLADPVGVRGPVRVRRGGGYSGTAANCRSAKRSAFRPSYRFNILGLRPCMVPSSTVESDL